MIDILRRQAKQNDIEFGIAKEFETGNPKYTAGKSGIEIAMDKVT